MKTPKEVAQGILEGRVLPSLISKEPEKEHSPQYKERVAKEVEQRSDRRRDYEVRRFLKNPSFGPTVEIRQKLAKAKKEKD